MIKNFYDLYAKQNGRERELSAVFVILVCFLEFVPVDAIAIFILAADLFADEIAGR